MLATDPSFGMAHCLKGYLLLMPFRANLLPAACAARHKRGVRASVQRHTTMPMRVLWKLGLQAIRNRAVAIWNRFLQDHPHDVLTFKLAQFVNF